MPRSLRWPNLNSDERKMLSKIKGLDVSYSTADTNYGPVISSRELVKEQCRLNLEDEKGTYCHIVDQSREDILDEILYRLLNALLPFKSKGEAWQWVCDTLLRHSREAAKTGRLRWSQ